jgi:hypothetical protein
VDAELVPFIPFGAHEGFVDRFAERGFQARQSPVLPGTLGLVRKVKLLCRFYEREMAAYALLRGIEYIYEECPFAEGST